jgi:hypothetical protein
VSAAVIATGPHNGHMAILPTPRNILELSRYAVGQVVESAAAAATVPVRLFQVLGQVELLVNRMSLATERAEALIGRVEAVVEDAEDAVVQTRVVMSAAALAIDEATRVASGAGTVVDGAALTVDGVAAVVDGARLVSEAAARLVVKAEGTAGEAADLLDGYAPTLREAAPLARRFVSELTEEEVTAAIRMVDELPRLRHHLANDVMPLLGTLDKVGPDLHQLLDVTRDLHLAVAGIPGLKMLRRRGEDKLADDEATDGR